MSAFMFAENADIKYKLSFAERWGAVMDWTKEYNRERRMSWEDIANAIHDTVTIDKVLALYSPETPRRSGRCPCPIHNGKDYNFSFSRFGYKCFVCGASGDVISLVKELLRLSTRSDAMKRINADFHLNLPLDSAISDAQSAEIDRRRAEARERKRANDKWWERYHALLDEWIWNDKIKRTAEPFSDAWCNAVRRLEIIGYELDGMPEEPR